MKSPSEEIELTAEFEAEETCKLHDGEHELLCFAYKENRIRIAVYYLLGLCTGFLTFLLGYWYPYHRIKITHSRCSFSEGNIVIVRGAESTTSVCPMRTVLVSSQQSISRDPTLKHLSVDQPLRIIVYNSIRFLWDPVSNKFDQLLGFDNKADLSDLWQWDSHFEGPERSDLLAVYGKNVIDVPIKSFLRIFAETSLNPFYIFQVFSCILWITDDYILLAVTILVISFITLVVSTYQTRKRLKEIREMISQSTTVNLIRSMSEDHIEKTPISSDELVPGDIILVEDGQHLMFDAVLIQGKCVTSEALLTGESVPVHKIPISEMSDAFGVFSSSSHKRQTLYNGTDVMQVATGNHHTLAVVVSTGYATVKGRFIRNMVNMDPVGFVSFRDSLKFVLLVAIIAFCGFLYSVAVLVKHGTPTLQIIRRALDCLTLAVSPALPLSLALGTLFAVSLLKLHEIYCTDMQKIFSCGKLKLACFDKTGTLTESMLNLAYVLPSVKGCFPENIRQSSNVSPELVQGMASCHSLTMINDVMSGDPLDLETFNFSRYHLSTLSDEYEVGNVKPVCCVATPDDINQIFVLKQFLFESALKRMGVVTSDGSNTLRAYIKGAPEVLKELCHVSSLPPDYDLILSQLTVGGYRVIAYAMKDLEEGVLTKKRLSEMSRVHCEVDMTFLGFVVLENKVKPETGNVIEVLRSAQIPSIMATGDNKDTAVAVAYTCGLLSNEQPVLELCLNADKDVFLREIYREGHDGVQNDENHSNGKFAYLLMPVIDFLPSRWFNKNDPRTRELPQLVVVGDTFSYVRTHHYEVYSRLLVLGRVYARMAPSEKAVLVEDLQAIGLTTCMCGDGANDCMALKTAEAGISLSDAEASIAAPFTSKVRDISCVPILIREGRSALVTSFSCFMYIVLYCNIQFSNVLVLYSVNSFLGNNQFLFSDLAFFTIFIPAMVEVRSSRGLSKQRPLGKLFHPVFATSVFGHLFIQVFFQVLLIVYVQQTGWYKPPREFKHRVGTLVTECYENTVTYACSLLQYVLAAFISCQGPPFRDEIYNNVRFSSLLLVSTLAALFIIVHPGAGIQKMLYLTELPYLFALSLVFLMGGSAYLSYLLDLFVNKSARFKSFVNVLRRKKAPRNKYKHILAEILNSR